jgi:hypothetical protein
MKTLISLVTAASLAVTGAVFAAVQDYEITGTIVEVGGSVSAMVFETAKGDCWEFSNRLISQHGSQCVNTSERAITNASEKTLPRPACR